MLSNEIGYLDIVTHENGAECGHTRRVTKICSFFFTGRQLQLMLKRQNFPGFSANHQRIKVKT